MDLMNTLVFSMKMFKISVVVVSLAVVIKSSVPFALNGFPIIWSIILSWSKPPFLYLVINGIILTIVASSRFFHYDNSQKSNVLSEPLVSAVKATLPADLAVLSPQLEISPAALAVYDQIEEELEELKSVMVKASEVSSKTEREDGKVEVDGIVAVFPDPKLTHNTASAYMISTHLQVEHSLQVTEKPLVSSRFSHRKPIRSSTPEGANALRVARPKRQETVENTWKAITEGCHVPLTRHHHKKKHDPPKSDTFKGQARFDPSSYRIRREPSLSRDELNYRVEAFIKKFNEDMRLQRQQSLQQYMEMIHRGP